jgi:cephalosporin hydroxylase
MTVYQRLLVMLFHRLYYNSWKDGGPRSISPGTLSLHWLGHQMIKCPMDLWVYQEILVERRPDWVVESGTFRGGTSLFLASIMELMAHGQVISIDPVVHDGRPAHPRIHYLEGSSTSPEVFGAIKAKIRDGERCVVILDADHSYDHVIAELRLYRQMIGVGDFLIVEDTNVNGHPVFPEFGPGPMEAVRQFLKEDERFVSDPAMERFLLTMNPNGYLRRVK